MSFWAMLCWLVVITARRRSRLRSTDGVASGRQLRCGRGLAWKQVRPTCATRGEPHAAAVHSTQPAPPERGPHAGSRSGTDCVPDRSRCVGTELHSSGERPSERPSRRQGNDEKEATTCAGRAEGHGRRGRQFRAAVLSREKCADHLGQWIDFLIQNQDDAVPLDGEVAVDEPVSQITRLHRSRHDHVPGHREGADSEPQPARSSRLVGRTFH